MADTIKKEELLDLLENAPMYRNKVVSEIRPARAGEMEEIRDWSDSKMACDVRYEKIPGNMWVIIEKSFDSFKVITEEEAKEIIARSTPLACTKYKFIQKEWVRAITNPLSSVPEESLGTYYLDEDALYPPDDYMLEIECNEEGNIKKDAKVYSLFKEHFEEYYEKV